MVRVMRAKWTSSSSSRGQSVAGGGLLRPLEVAGRGLDAAKPPPPLPAADAERVPAGVEVLAPALGDLETPMGASAVRLAAEEDNGIGQELSHFQGEGLL